MTQPGVVEIREPATAVINVDAPRTLLYEVDAVVSVLEQMTGLTGPAGPPGPAGPQGPSGGTAIQQRFVVPATTWNVQHNLNTYPVVTVLDPNGAEVSADVTYTDMNSVVVTFAVPFAGTVWLNT